MDNEFLKLVGQRIRDNRDVAGMDIETLARRAKLSPSVISYIEHGCQPSLTTVYRIARALGVSLETLLPPVSEYEHR